MSHFGLQVPLGETQALLREAAIMSLRVDGRQVRTVRACHRAVMRKKDRRREHEGSDAPSRCPLALRYHAPHVDGRQVRTVHGYQGAAIFIHSTPSTYSVDK